MITKDDQSFPTSVWSIFLKDWKYWLFGAIFSFICASVLMSGFPSGLSPNLQYPLTYHNDGFFGTTQRLIEGWVFENPRSGYPFGSTSFDYPSADSGHYAILKLFGFLSGNWYAAFNLYFLVGFSIVFIFSFCVLRSFGLTIPFAFTSALIFNFLPFHFQRIPHLFYTWYFTIPIFWYISLNIYSSRLLPEKIELSHIKKIAYAIFFSVLGSFGIYYALFGLIIIGTVTISAFVDRYNVRTLKVFLFISGFIVFGVLLNLTPSLLYRYQNGINTEVAQRDSSDAELYGFKFRQLIMPRLDHRNEYLNQKAESYFDTSPLITENYTSSLGMIGSLGLILVLWLLFCVLSNKPQHTILRVSSLIVLVLMFFGFVGGVGSVFSELITSSIRGWNRISIFIAFGTIFVFFMLLQSELQKRFVGRRFMYISSVILIGILLIGFYDQTTSPCISCNENIKKTFDMDRKFITSIEDSLPAGSAIYQLPYMSFPESPSLHRLKEYELSMGFLNSSLLRWSYMGMKGRPGDLFYRSLSKEPIPKQLEVIRNLGFAGIYVDTRGFYDNGEAVIGTLTKLLGSHPVIVREDGEIVFFALNETKSVDFKGLNNLQIMEKVGYIADHLGSRYVASYEEGIDFTRPDFPVFVKDVQGLSVLEKWGRWSDANVSPSVRIEFTQPLPQTFTLEINVNAFDPNIGLPLKVRVGESEQTILLSEKTISDMIFETDGSAHTIELIPPNPTSPNDIDITSNDSRKLGIGLISLKIKD